MNLAYSFNRKRVILVSLIVWMLLSLLFISTSVVAEHSKIVTLENGDSYHFLTETKGKYSGGDFYLSSEATQFYANNVGQRGLQDLGSLGHTPLNAVTIPETGYTRFGVAVVIGHTYVSLAREGEEGHYIVFRVQQAVLDEYITLEYCYTPPLEESEYTFPAYLIYIIGAAFGVLVLILTMRKIRRKPLSPRDQLEKEKQEMIEMIDEVLEEEKKRW